MTHTIIYNDKWIYLLLVPIAAITTSNLGVEDWMHEISQAYFIPNNLWALVVGYSGWIIVKTINRRCDEKYTFLKSLFYQLSISIPLVTITFTLLDFIYVRYFWGAAWPQHSDFLQTELLMALVWVVVLLLVYTIRRLANSQVDLPSTAGSLSIQAVKGSETYQLKPEEVAYFFLEGKVVFAKTVHGQNYMISKSLNELTTALDGHEFFRANRQLILRKEALEKYEQLETRKLELTLNPPPDTQHFISKTKITEFKSWLNA